MDNQIDTPSPNDPVEIKLGEDSLLVTYITDYQKEIIEWVLKRLERKGEKIDIKVYTIDEAEISKK
jgi:hypothetical protein